MLKKNPSNVSDISDDHPSGMEYKICICSSKMSIILFRYSYFIHIFDFKT